MNLRPFYHRSTTPSTLFTGKAGLTDRGKVALDSVSASRYNKTIKRRCRKAAPPNRQFIQTKKPLLGRVAVSAFYGDSDRVFPYMKCQCNRHNNTSFRRCDGTAFLRLATPQHKFYRNKQDLSIIPASPIKAQRSGFDGKRKKDIAGRSAASHGEAQRSGFAMRGRKCALLFDP